MEDEVARFWQAFETETGERVEAKAMGELRFGEDDARVWCLLVLTDQSFWFKQVPSDNWITSFFHSGARFSMSRPADEHTLRIAREHLLALEEPNRKRLGWFSRPAFPELTLTWRDGETIGMRRFSMDPSTDLLPRLRFILRDPARG